MQESVDGAQKYALIKTRGCGGTDDNLDSTATSRGNVTCIFADRLQRQQDLGYRIST